MNILLLLLLLMKDLRGAPPCWGLLRTQRPKWRLINRHPKQWLKPWAVSEEARYGDSTIRTSAHVASHARGRLDQALYKSPYLAGLCRSHSLSSFVEDQVSGASVPFLPSCSVSGRLFSYWSVLSTDFWNGWPFLGPLKPFFIFI